MTLARDHRIDFFRGLALIFIFWDHVPHNPLGQITLRNFGFSDAAEDEIRRHCEAILNDRERL